jgi:hypothetical protein
MFLARSPLSHYKVLCEGERKEKGMEFIDVKKALEMVDISNPIESWQEGSYDSTVIISRYENGIQIAFRPVSGEPVSAWRD